jgi:lipopolysaccharide export system protein LptA
MLISVVGAEEMPKSLLDNIQITADNMQYDPSNKSATARGNVKLVYMVNGLPVTLTSTTLHAQFDDSGNLTNATAEDNVEVTYDLSHLSAQTCTHDFKKQRTVCTGPDVVLTKNNDIMHGNVATLDISTQVFKMHATEKNQVTGIIHPEPPTDRKRRLS